MSKQKTKRYKLPPLQKKVLLCLAKMGPQTINEIKNNIPQLEPAHTSKSHYKPTWMAVKSLIQKNLVHQIALKKYRGRKYPKLWLTDEGVIAAVIEGVDPNGLLKKTRDLYPDNQILLYFLEIAPKLNPEVFRIGYSAIKSKGKLEPIDLATILFTQMQTETHTQVFKQAIEILKRYPKEHKSFRQQIEKLSENLNQIKEII